MASRPSLLGLLGRSAAWEKLTIGPARSGSLNALIITRGAKNTSSRADVRKEAKKKKRKHPNYKLNNLADAQQYALCDAMRYIRAFEVGQDPNVPKYDLHIRLKTKKDGPVIRNQLKLPYAVKTDLKIFAICPPGSAAARAAVQAGATMVGEDECFELLKTGKVKVDRVIAHPSSMPKLTKAGLPRVLGPRGLMPSTKMGTLVEDIGKTIDTMMGGNQYRERYGMLRMAVGQLGFTPEQLRSNVRAFIDSIQKDAAGLLELHGVTKQIHEVVLSSTRSPAFVLSGDFRSDSSVSLKALSTP